MNPEQRIKELGLVLPSGSAPAANYVNAVRTGNLLFIAGKAPLPENGKLPKGRLGREYTAEEGYRFARSAALEDAAILSRVLKGVEADGLSAAFKLYEAIRKPRSSAIQAGSSSNTLLKDKTDPSWVYGYDSTTVPLTEPAAA